MAKAVQTRDYAFTTLDVFTRAPFSGNPLAIVWDADLLSSKQMQSIAAEFGYSETVFVLEPQNKQHHAKLRIFTPTFEIDFAGHPTIGSALAIAQAVDHDANTVMTLEENAGDVHVDFKADEAGLTARFQPPVLPEILSEHTLDLVDAIGCAQTQAVVVASAGTPFAFVQLRDARAVDACAVGPALGQVLSENGATGLFVFARSVSNVLYARMFAPDMGVPEDPATGSAVAALAAILWRTDTRTGEYIVKQGVKMGRPSTIGLTVAGRPGHPIDTVYVSGTATQMMRGTIKGPYHGETTEAQ